MSETTSSLRGGFAGLMRGYRPGTDVGLAVAVVALLSVLILPLPPAVLDVGLALSITASVLLNHCAL